MKSFLVEATSAWSSAEDRAVAVESIGGVVAARRVNDGEPIDVVILSDEAIDKLIASGRLSADTKVDIADAHLAAAVRTGSQLPDMHDDNALRDALLSARTVGLSTGPSGTAIRFLLTRWGLIESLGARLIQAPPGVPIGSMVAQGEVELGFQQLSELVHIEGVEVISRLPPSLDVVTRFAGAIGVDSARAAEAKALLAFLASPSNDAARQVHGLQPVR